MGTYDCILVRLENLRVVRDLLITGFLGRYINRNVSIGLGEGVVDLVGELQDVVLDLTLAL